LDYDPETGLFVWKKRTEKHIDARWMNVWNARYAGKPAFIHCCYGLYLRASIFSKFYSAHRVAWAIVYGDPVPEVLDHIDGDRQNNRISNLRPASSSENSKNRGIRCDNTSGRTGIHLTRAGSFKVRIFVNGRDTYLGTFRNIGDAIVARQNAEKRFGFSEGHGERKAVGRDAGRPGSLQ
jgi:hypothetical protein